MDEYRRFLHQFRCEKGSGVAYTHTSIGNPKSSYAIPADRMEGFYEVYNRAMVKGMALHLTEKPMDPSPMRADLDFRFPMVSPKPDVLPRKYRSSHVKAIVKAYCNLIAEYIPSEYHHLIVAYVMEKTAPTEYRGKIKDGIHIVWPHIVLPHTLHHLIRKHMLNNASTTFSGLSVCNTFEEIIDHAIIDKNNWQLYGSRKPDCEAYRVTNVFKYIPAIAADAAESLEATEPVTNGASTSNTSISTSTASSAVHSAMTTPNASASSTPAVSRPASPRKGKATRTVKSRLVATVELLEPPTAAEELTFVRMFSMRDKQYLAVPVRDDKTEEVEQYIRHVLPSHGERRKGKLNTQIFGKSINLNKSFASEDDFILAKELVECLNPKRAENYEDWIKLGWTLRNIDYRLLDTWVDFSRVSSKYMEGECNQLWNTMRTDTLGMGTMRWWARQDNPQKYEEIRNSNVTALIDRCCGSSGAHYDIACVVHALFKDKYRFTVKDTWYMYVEDKHRWLRTREGLKLRMVLSNDVWRRFADRSYYWAGESGKSTDQNDQERFNAKSKTLSEICTRLKSAGFKDSVMKECKALFTDENFEELLDSHQHLIGFENGVFDLRLHEFREGLPDDFISFSTGRHYLNYDANSAEAKEIEAYLAQVFTNANIRNYMKSMLACIIDGSIRQEKFYIFTGSGCHAKDTEIMLYDGTKKLVQDIATSDILMGDDSTPREVLQLFRGKSMMYQICPEDSEPFEVNMDHKLTLQVTTSPYIFQDKTITRDQFVVKWIQCVFSTPDDGSIVRGNEGYFSDVDDANAFMASLKSKDDVLCSGDIIDVQVKNYVNWNMSSLGLRLFKTRIETGSTHEPADAYDAYNAGYAWKTHEQIPDIYKYGSLIARTDFLKGVRDRQGSVLATQNPDIAYLAQSVGMRCKMTDEGIAIAIAENDPMDLRYTFTVNKLAPADYYGFEVSDNHRYVMGNFFVTANSNSKSIYLNLLQRAIGDYYCILPIALLTQKRTASNAAQSELERTKGRRCAVMQEPGESEKLNIGLMKELSGGDRILTRGLFKEPIEFKPQFKMIMTCNELPEVPSDDGGTWRRIRVIEYTSRFVDKPDPSKPKEFPIDPDISDKLDRWADTFISMIIDHHKRIDPKSVDEPMEVRIATEGYKKNNDVIGQYVADRIVRDTQTVEKIQLLKLFQDFKSWAFQNVPKSKKLPDRTQFRAYFEKSFGAYPTDGKGWKGVSIKKSAQDSDEEDEDETIEAPKQPKPPSAKK